VEAWARLRLVRALAASARVTRTVEAIQAREPDFNHRPLSWAGVVALLARFGLTVERRRDVHDAAIAYEVGRVFLDERVDEGAPWAVFVALHELVHAVAHRRLFRRSGGRLSPALRTRTEAEANSIALLGVEPWPHGAPFPVVTDWLEPERYYTGDQVVLEVVARGRARRVVFERRWRAGATVSAAADPGREIRSIQAALQDRRRSGAERLWATVDAMNRFGRGEERVAATG
jgi:hypothetical protein